MQKINSLQVAYKSISELVKKINTLLKRYDEMDAEITRLFISGHNAKTSPQILTLEALKRACKDEVNQLRTETIKIKKDAKIIS